MQELKRGAVPLAGLALVLLAYLAREARSGGLVQAVAVSLMVVIAAALVVWPQVRWLMPVVVPLLLAGTLAQFRSQTHVSAVVVIPAALGLLAAVLLAAGVDLGSAPGRAYVGRQDATGASRSPTTGRCAWTCASSTTSLAPA